MISRPANAIFIALAMPEAWTLQKTKNRSSKLGGFSYLEYRVSFAAPDDLPSCKYKNLISGLTDLALLH